MLAAFKLYLMPILVYLGVFWAAGQGLFKRASVPVFLFLILVEFPQFWYPTHDFPLGSMSLTILGLSALIGGYRQRPPGDPPAPHHGFVLVLIVSSYVAVWVTSSRYGLGMPLTGAHDLVPAWRNYALMLSLYYVGYSAIRTEDTIRRVLLLYCWVIIVMAWREIANFVSGDVFSYNRRSVGPFYIVGMGANHFAAFIAHISVIAVGLYAMDTHKWRRRLYLVCFVASLYPLFFSYSRGAYVAVLLALLVVGVIRYRALLPVLGIFLLFWDSLLPTSVVDRIQMTESPDGQIEESAALRLVVWDLAEKLFHDNPIFGIGFQGFYYASNGLPLRNVHNYFLQTACEQGVFGIVLLALFFLKAGWTGWRLYRLGSTPFYQGIGLGFIACLSAVAVTNLFGDRFSQLGIGSYLWLLFGIVDRALVLSLQRAQSAPVPAVEPVRPGPPSPLVSRPRI